MPHASSGQQTEIRIVFNQPLPVVQLANLFAVQGHESESSFLEFIDGMQVGPGHQVDGIVQSDASQQETGALVFQVLDVVDVGSGKQQTGSIFRQSRTSAAGVDVVEQLLENFRFDVFDRHLFRLGFFHVVLEHGGEDGAPGRQNRDVAADFLAYSVDPLETELDVAVGLLDVEIRKLSVGVDLSDTFGEFHPDDAILSGWFPLHSRHGNVEFFRLPLAGGEGLHYAFLASVDAGPNRAGPVVVIGRAATHDAATGLFIWLDVFAGLDLRQTKFDDERESGFDGRTQFALVGQWIRLVVGRRHAEFRNAGIEMIQLKCLLLFATCSGYHGHEFELNQIIAQFRELQITAGNRG